MEARNLSRHSTQPVMLQTARAAIVSCEKLESDFRNKGDYCHNNIGAKTHEDWERMDKFLLDAADEMKKIRRCMKFLATVSSRQNLHNCDIGTAEEQNKRFSKFCGSNADPMDIDGWACDWRCPLYENHPKCKEAWAQMPYEEGGVEHDRK